MKPVSKDDFLKLKQCGEIARQENRAISTCVPHERLEVVLYD
jgi:hypothetical protein